MYRLDRRYRLDRGYRLDRSFLSPEPSPMRTSGAQMYNCLYTRLLYVGSYPIKPKREHSIIDLLRSLSGFDWMYFYVAVAVYAAVAGCVAIARLALCTRLSFLFLMSDDGKWKNRYANPVLVPARPVASSTLTIVPPIFWMRCCSLNQLS